MANRIRELRLNRNLTQKEMAKNFNDFLKKNLPEKPNKSPKQISYATLSRWENGESEPKFEIWVQLATFFDVPVSYVQGADKNSDSIKENIKESQKIIQNHFSKKINDFNVGFTDYTQMVAVTHFIETIQTLYSMNNDLYIDYISLISSTKSFLDGELGKKDIAEQLKAYEDILKKIVDISYKN